MDKAEPKDKVVCRHEQECRPDSNMDSDVCLSAHCVFEVSVRPDKKYATNNTLTSAKFI